MVAGATLLAGAGPHAQAAGEWRARLVDGPRGQACVQAGQLGSDGSLGRVLPGGRFRAHESGDMMVCGPARRTGRDGALLVRRFVGDPTAERPRFAGLVVA